jgi:hypothetical protein
MSDVIAYHVSTKPFSVGQQVSLQGESNFVTRKVKCDPCYQQSELLIDEKRPRGVPGRLISRRVRHSGIAKMTTWDLRPTIIELK